MAWLLASIISPGQHPVKKEAPAWKDLELEGQKVARLGV